MKTKAMRRKEASRLIDAVRTAIACGVDAKGIEKLLSREWGLEPLVPCTGHAHSPEVGGMQDHCSYCAPRWGWTGDAVEVR